MKWKQLHEKASSILASMNINLSTTKLVSELTLAEKQMILIARAVSKECKFLILDEPTAPLSHTETKELFRIVADLKKKKVGIIFISHRLPEIFEICDEISIMRNGELAARQMIADTTQNNVIEQMLGKKLGEQFPDKTKNIGNNVLEVNGLTDKEKIKDFSMHVKSGEIVGIAGLVGAGKTELCKALFGAEGKLVSGEVVLKGNKLKIKSPFDAVKVGMAFVPEERRKEGILVQESVESNLTAANLGGFSRMLGFIDRKKKKLQPRN